MSLDLVLAVAGGLVAGLVVALRAIAPKTETAKDNELLAWLEKVLPYLPQGSLLKAEAEAKAAEVAVKVEAKK